MYLFTVVLKSSIRWMLRKRGSLAPMLYGLLIYALLLFRFVFVRGSSPSLPLLRSILTGFVFASSLILGLSSPRSLSSAETLFRSFGLPERRIRAAGALVLSLPLAFMLLAFSPFFAVSGKLLFYIFICLAALAAYAFLRAIRPQGPKAADRKFRLRLPFFLNLIRFFCRPWTIAFAYPLASFLSLPLSRLVKGEGSDNRLAILIGAEYIFSFFANFGVDNSLKAEYLLPYPVGFRRWQTHFHLLSFLFLLPGRIAALLCALGPEGYQFWLLRLMACDLLLLPFLFDPPPVIALGIFFSYCLFSLAFLAGHPVGAVVVSLLCIPAFFSSRKDFRDTPYLSGGIRGRAHIL